MTRGGGAPRGSEIEGEGGGHRLPMWLKLVYLGFVAVLVPAYTVEHGLGNFFWFSNVALLLGLVAVWRESRWLASTQLISVGVFELMWIVGFVVGLLRGGRPPFGITGYMFDPTIPLLVRGLSLYHIVLPVLLAWLVWRLGYDQRAWRVWVPIGWATVLLTFFLTPPARNVNWVYGPGEDMQQVIPPWAWLVLLLAGFTVVWAVSHVLIVWVLQRVPGSKARLG